MHKSEWLMLILTLPTANASARMRYWRALKALGCGALRDGAYLLPRSSENDHALRKLADGIDEGGGSTHVLYVTSKDFSQESAFRALFDRTEECTEFRKTLGQERRKISGLALSELGRLAQRLRRDWEALQATDHFPNEASAVAATAWSEFEERVRDLLSPDEPHSGEGRIPVLNKPEYQGRTWATRRGLWVDRVASAWLIRRFIDLKATFLWLSKPNDCPRKALGFDFDGAAFTHVGEFVTFQVLMASFELDSDAGLIQLGELIRSLDVGGTVVPEASGFEAVLTGARQRCKDDDALLTEMSSVLDSLYSHYSNQSKRSAK